MFFHPISQSCMMCVEFLSTLAFSSEWYKDQILAFRGQGIGLSDRGTERCGEVVFIWRQTLQDFRDYYFRALRYLEESYLERYDFLGYEFQAMGSVTNHPIIRWVQDIHQEQNHRSTLYHHFANQVHHSDDQQHARTLEQLLHFLQLLVFRISCYIRRFLFRLDARIQVARESRNMWPECFLLWGLWDSLNSFACEFDRLDWSFLDFCLPPSSSIHGKLASAIVPPPTPFPPTLPFFLRWVRPYYLA